MRRRIVLTGLAARALRVVIVAVVLLTLVANLLALVGVGTPGHAHFWIGRGGNHHWTTHHDPWDDRPTWHHVP